MGQLLFVQYVRWYIQRYHSHGTKSLADGTRAFRHESVVLEHLHKDTILQNVIAWTAVASQYGDNLLSNHTAVVSSQLVTTDGVGSYC